MKVFKTFFFFLSLIVGSKATQIQVSETQVSETQVSETQVSYFKNNKLTKTKKITFRHPEFPSAYSDTTCDVLANEPLHQLDIGIGVDKNMFKYHGKSLFERLEQLVYRTNLVLRSQFNFRIHPQHIVISSSGMSWDCPPAGGGITEQFNEWKRFPKPSEQPIWHLFGLSCSDTLIKGLAITGARCNGGVSVTHDYNFYDTWVTFAHEIGHNLNAVHVREPCILGLWKQQIPDIKYGKTNSKRICEGIKYLKQTCPKLYIPTDVPQSIGECTPSPPLGRASSCCTNDHTVKDITYECTDVFGRPGYCLRGMCASSECLRSSLYTKPCETQKDQCQMGCMYAGIRCVKAFDVADGTFCNDTHVCKNGVPVFPKIIEPIMGYIDFKSNITLKRNQLKNGAVMFSNSKIKRFTLHVFGLKKKDQVTVNPFPKRIRVVDDDIFLTGTKSAHITTTKNKKKLAFQMDFIGVPRISVHTHKKIVIVLTELN